MPFESIVLQRLPEEACPIKMVSGRDVWWHEAMKDMSDE